MGVFIWANHVMPWSYLQAYSEAEWLLLCEINGQTHAVHRLGAIVFELEKAEKK